jgi:hypothetical protein
MPKAKRKSRSAASSEAAFTAKPRTVVPHEFVLDALAALAPVTRPMFGCLAVYVEEKIMLILRDRPTHRQDNGVWIGTAIAHHESLRREFPHMRSVRVFGKPVTDWQVIPAEADDFEGAALRACALIRAADPRIGRIPKRRGPAAKTTAGPRRAARVSRQS